MPGSTDVEITHHSRGFGSYTLVDVETTGLNEGRHRVLSVAALTLGADGHITDEFHTLINPGCDPGPVHIHGLTRAKLHGAPAFEDIREQLAPHLAGRVLVAHNAQFDYRFLAREFSRTGGPLPVPHRLCTLALANRVALPTNDIKLGTLAAYYGVPQARAHDALDDARVLGGVLRGLVADAARLGIPPPLLKCPPKSTASPFPAMRSDPKTPCAYTWPGPLRSRLVQGMKIAVTGDTTTMREELVRRAEAAGLDATSVVSRFTSVLVSNEHLAQTRKMEKAREHGTPVLDEMRFLRLLDDVQPGTRKGAAIKVSVPRPEGSPTAGPLAGHRFLVIGGTHTSAAAARTRIAELGGSVAVNLSKTVTDVVGLAGSEEDPRMRRARKLGLVVHGPAILYDDVAPSPVARSAFDSVTEPTTLMRGQVVDLPATSDDRTWTLRCSWTHREQCEVDVVAFLVNDIGRVGDDGDFVFYNQPEGRGVRLGSDGPNEQSISVDLDQLPDYCTRIVVAAAIDGEDVTFGDVGAIEISVAPGIDGVSELSFTLDAATKERSLLLAEIYQRGDAWRIRAVGQGYPFGLLELANGYGVVVDD